MGDCGALAAEEQAAALFGAANLSTRDRASFSPPPSLGSPRTDRPASLPRPGWLELAAEGVLLLTDVVALAPEVQLELARALSDKKAGASEWIAQASYPLSARLVLSARQPLPALLASHAWCPSSRAGSSKRVYGSLPARAA